MTVLNDAERPTAIPPSIPLACTLPAAELSLRKVQIGKTLLADALELAELADGYALRYSAEYPLTTLTDFIHAERACCRFMTFELHASPDAIVLRMRGSAEIKAFIHSHFVSN